MPRKGIGLGQMSSIPTTCRGEGACYLQTAKVSRPRSMRGIPAILETDLSTDPHTHKDDIRQVCSSLVGAESGVDFDAVMVD